MKELRHWIINDLPTDGEWWQKSTETAYIKIAKAMFEAGIPIDEIKQLLEDIYSSTASEYGG